MALPDPSTPLTPADAGAAFAAILDGSVDDAAIAAFLVALSDRGETAVEIAAAARAMRARLIPVDAPANAIDVCGTGGDGHHTLNVSTAVAIVVAACGVPVAKHGNRAASSKAGAADTLEALGLDLDRAAVTAAATLADLGIAFLFANNHHPAMARIAPIRRALGRRTIFNLMGPLANPAGVTRQLIGIARPAYVPIYAAAMADLGSGHSLIVAGDEGLDELSLAGGNEVYVGDSSAENLMRRARPRILPVSGRFKKGTDDHTRLVGHQLLERQAVPAGTSLIGLPSGRCEHVGDQPARASGHIAGRHVQRRERL